MSIKIIDHKFLESGHSQMEVDSIHAAIETAKKSISVYMPRDWQTVCQLARRKKGYNIIPLNHTSFLDFKALSKQIMPGLSQIQWLKVKWMRYEIEARPSDQPSNNHPQPSAVQILYKYKFDEDFRKVPDRKIRSATQVETPPKAKQLYPGRLSISEEKKRDLLQLCSDGTIPSEYHEYYKGLPTTSVAEPEKLPEPDMEEDSESE